MSVARFIDDQGTRCRVPHTISCALLGGQRGVVLQVVGPRHGPVGDEWSAHRS